MAGKKQTSEKSFDERMKRLEDVVLRLEAPDVSLEEVVALYKEGQQLAAACRKQLTCARQEVAVLTEEGGLEPLSPEQV